MEIEDKSLVANLKRAKDLVDREHTNEEVGVSDETFKLTKDQYLGAKTFQDINEYLKDKYFVTQTYHNQYAEGITGVNRAVMFHVNEGRGFSSKSGAREYVAELKKTNKSKVTQKNRGYGALGTFYGVPEIVQGKDLKSHGGYTFHPTERLIIKEKSSAL